MKEVSGPEPLWTARPVTGRPARPSAPTLGPATQRSPVTPFEQALREAIPTLKASMARVDAESDPLARHLGYRSLNRDLGERGLDERPLSQPEDRDYARELLDTARRREAQSFAALDDAARSDLETLLRREERLHAREDAAAWQAAAARDEASDRGRVERLQRTLERDGAAAEKLAGVKRPRWMSVLAAVLALACLAGLAVAGLPGAWARGVSAVGWPTALGAMGLIGLGAWLGMDPRARLAWLHARARRLTESRRGAAERAARAAEALARARKLFEQVDDECRREEAAAQAILQRRPGAQRYVSRSATVVVREVDP